MCCPLLSGRSTISHMEGRVRTMDGALYNKIIVILGQSGDMEKIGSICMRK